MSHFPPYGSRYVARTAPPSSATALASVWISLGGAPAATSGAASPTVLGSAFFVLRGGILAKSGGEGFAAPLERGAAERPRGVSPRSVDRLGRSAPSRSESRCNHAWELTSR